MTAFVGVNYTEFEPETYRGVFVSFHEDGVKQEHKRVEYTEAGWPQDLENAIEYAKAHADKVFTSSSVDNFKSDLKLKFKED